MRLSQSFIDRHRKFWNRTEVNKPLIDFYHGGVFALAGLEGVLEDGLLIPEMVVPERFRRWYRTADFLFLKLESFMILPFPLRQLIGWKA